MERVEVSERFPVDRAAVVAVAVDFLGAEHIHLPGVLADSATVQYQ